MRWWKRIAQSRWLDAAAMVLALACAVRVATELPGRIFQYDFNHYYLASWVLREGGDPYSTELRSVGTQFGFLIHDDLTKGTNPPPLLWAFVPLTMLSPASAFYVWAGVQIFCLAVVLWYTRRLLGGRLTARGWRFVCAAAVMWDAVFLHFYFSRVELVLAAMVLVAYDWHRQGRHTSAAVMVGAAGLLKLYPLFLLPWFLWRGGANWSARFRLAARVLIFLLAAILCTRWDVWQSFSGHGLGTVFSWVGRYFGNVSLPSLVAMLGHAAHWREPVRWGLISGLAFWAMAYAICAFRGGDREGEFCFLSVAMLGGSMTTWGSYLVFLIFPLTVMAVRVLNPPSPRRILEWAVTCLLLSDLTVWVSPVFQRHPYAGIFANFLPLYGLVVLAMFFGRELRNDRVTAPVPGSDAGRDGRGGKPAEDRP